MQAIKREKIRFKNEILHRYVIRIERITKVMAELFGLMTLVSNLYRFLVITKALNEPHGELPSSNTAPVRSSRIRSD